MVMQEMLLALQEMTRTPTLLRPHPERYATMVKSRAARMELQLQAVVAVTLPTPSGCVFGQSNGNIMIRANAQVGVALNVVWTSVPSMQADCGPAILASTCTDKDSVAVSTQALTKNESTALFDCDADMEHNAQRARCPVEASG